MLPLFVDDFCFWGPTLWLFCFTTALCLIDIIFCYISLRTIRKPAPGGQVESGASAFDDKDAFDEDKHGLQVLLPPTATPTHIFQLPKEILGYIVHILIEPALIESQMTIRDYRKYKSFLRIMPWAGASKLLYYLTKGKLETKWAVCGYEFCLSHATLGEVVRLARSIQVITADEGCLELQTDLSLYSQLLLASIDYHNGWDWHEQTQSYRLFQNIVAFPISLIRLEILHMHASENNVIALVSKYCPHLVELLLVCCTMFNNPSCLWWHQHNHGYLKGFATGGVLVYAHDRLSQLRKLPSLQVLHLGHYMMEIGVTYTHRTLHREHHPFEDVTNPFDAIGARNMAEALAIQAANGGPPINMGSILLASREFWAAECPKCERELMIPIERAEHLAVSVLAQLPSLRMISFADFLSDKRIRPCHWYVKREVNTPSNDRDQWIEIDRTPNAPANGTHMRVIATGGRINQRFDPYIFTMRGGAWEL